MENHPIPQDITGFQFKLIGNMTVKQFAYLAAGIVLAWITIALPINISIRLLFAFIFSMIGVAFAFLPIQGRPLDIMFSHLMKALINPTQFVYQKSGARLFPASVFQPIPQNGQSKNQVSALSGEKLKAFLDSLPKKPGNKLDEKEMIFFQSLGAMAAPQAPTQPMPAFVQDHAFSNKIDDSSVIDDSIKTPKTPIEENDTEIQEEELEKEAKNLQDQLNQAKQQEQTQVGSANYDIAHAKVTELEQQLNESFLQKTELEKQLSTLKKQLESQKQIYKPSMAVSEKTETKNVRSIPREMGKSIGVLSAPEFPNLITGIIKDPRGNPLSNILVEIKDNEGNPVRAFKTNALGQFASATAITNGTYSIEFEDPKTENKFDTIEVTANGQIILPVEVISVDTREELRRSLFN